MARLVVVGVLLGPVLMVVAGVYILVATPDVVTQSVEYTHSHMNGVGLALIGGMLSLIAGMVAFVMVDR